MEANIWHELKTNPAEQPASSEAFASLLDQHAPGTLMVSKLIAVTAYRQGIAALEAENASWRAQSDADTDLLNDRAGMIAALEAERDALQARLEKAENAIGTPVAAMLRIDDGYGHIEKTSFSSFDAAAQLGFGMFYLVAIPQPSTAPAALSKKGPQA
jgi:hypothetical protein